MKRRRIALAMALSMLITSIPVNSPVVFSAEDVIVEDMAAEEECAEHVHAEAEYVGDAEVSEGESTEEQVLELDLTEEETVGEIGTQQQLSDAAESAVTDQIPEQNLDSENEVVIEAIEEAAAPLYLSEEGASELSEGKTISEIAFADAQEAEYTIYEAGNEIACLDLNISYTDDSQYTQMVGYGLLSSIFDDNGSSIERYQCWGAVNEYIYVEMQNEDGKAVNMPNRWNDYLPEPGTYTLVAYADDNEVRAEKSIRIVDWDTETIPTMVVGEHYAYANVGRTDTVCYQFTPSESGMYSVCVSGNEEIYTLTSFYHQENNRYRRINSNTDNEIYGASCWLDAETIYYITLGLNGLSDEVSSGTIWIDAKKIVTEISFGEMPKEYYPWSTQYMSNWRVPVELKYNDGSTMTKYFSGGGSYNYENSDEGIFEYTESDPYGTYMILQLYKDDVQVDMQAGWKEPGHYKMVFTCGELSAEYEFDVTPFPQGTALAADTSATYNVTNETETYFRITPGTSGTYSFAFNSDNSGNAAYWSLYEIGTESLSVLCNDRCFYTTDQCNISLEAGKTYGVRIYEPYDTAQLSGIVSYTKIPSVSDISASIPSSLEAAVAGQLLNTTTAVITYDDGSTETIQSWNTNWEDIATDEGEDDSYRILYATTEHGYQVKMRMSMKQEEGTSVRVDYPQIYEGSEIAIGKYIITVGIDEFDKSVSCESELKISEAPALSLDTEQNFSFDGRSGYAIYKIDSVAETGEYVIKVAEEHQDDEDEYAYRCAMYRMEDEKLVCVSDLDEAYGTYSMSVELAKDKSYLVVLQSAYNLTSTFGGTLKLSPKKNLSSIDFADASQMKVNADQFSAQLRKTAAVVTYSDQSKETIDDWSWRGYYDETTENWLWYLSAMTEESEQIYVKLYQDDSICGMPRDGNSVGDISPYGNFTLKAYAETNPNIAAEKQVQVTGVPDSAAELTLDQETKYEVPKDETKYWKLSIPESGIYVLNREDEDWWEGIRTVLYRVDTDKQVLEQVAYGSEWNFDCQFTIEASKDENYLLVLTSIDSPVSCNQGTLFAEKLKEIASVTVDWPSACDTFTWASMLRKAKVTIKYQDDSETEELTSWSRTWVYDDDDDDDYETLKVSTRQGRDLYLTITDEEDNRVIPPSMDLYSGDGEEELYRGTYQLSLSEQIGAKVLYSQKVTVGLPELEPISLTDQEITIQPNEVKVVLFEPSEDTAGKYLFYDKDEFYSDESYLAEYDKATDTLQVCGGCMDSLILRAELKAGNTYYLILNPDSRQRTLNLGIKTALDIKNISISSAPAQTEYLANMEYLSCIGTKLTLTYEDGSEQVISAGEWGSCYDSYRNYIECYLYKDDTEVSRYRKLKEGTYTLIFRTTDGAKDSVSISAISKEKAAEKNRWNDDDSLTLTCQLEQYLCALFTPNHTGTYKFASDAQLTLRVYEYGSDMPLSVNTNVYESNVALTEGKQYVLVMKPKQNAAEFTMTAELAKEICSAELVLNEEEMIAGLDYFTDSSFSTRVTYEDKTSVLLPGEQSDAQGNGFRYEIQEKNSGAEVYSYDDLEIGTYLVTAVHRTFSAIQSAPLSVDVKGVDFESLQELTEEQSYTLAPSGDRQLFAFVPSKSVVYRMEMGNSLSWDIFENTETGLKRTSRNLTAGKEYVVCIYKVSRATVITMTSKSIDSVTLNEPQTFTLQSGLNKSFLFEPESAGTYTVTVMKQGEASDDGGTELSISAYLDKEYLEYDYGVNTVALSRRMEKEPYELNIINYSDSDKTYQIVVSKKTSKKITSLSLTAKSTEGYHPLFAWEDRYDLNLFIDAKATYEDGTSEAVKLQQDDGYGNYIGGFPDTILSHSIINATLCFKVYASAENVYGYYDSYLHEYIELSFKPSTVPITALSEDIAADFTFAENGWQYFSFQPKTDGEYYIDMQNTACSVYLTTDSYTDYSNYWLDGYTSELSAGENYLIAVQASETESDSIENQIQIVRKKAVKSLTLLTNAEPFLFGYEQPSGMTAKVVYQDGSDAVISISDWYDDYGNEISTSFRRVTDDVARVYLKCGAYRVSCDVICKKADELPALNETEMTEIHMMPQKQYQQLYFRYTPKKSGVYQLGMNYDDEQVYQGIAPKFINAETGKIDYLPVTLEVGKTYIVRLSFYVLEECTIGIIPHCLDNSGECEHVFTNYVSDNNATCTSDGTKTAYCDNGCGTTNTITDTGSKLPHTLDKDNPVITKPATCLETGIKTYACKNCTYTEEEEIPVSTEHTWNAEKTVDREATCTSKGQKSIHCAICGVIDEKSVEEISMAAHTWDDGVVKVEATCTTEGYKTYTCTVCHTEELRKTDKAEHTWKTEPTTDIEATCTEAGQQSIHCSVCDTVKEGSVVVIPAKEHTWAEQAVTDVEATCTEDGKRSKHCTVCGTSDPESVETIKAAGHDFETIVTKDAGCATEGTGIKKCKVCYYEETYTIPAVGHKFPEDWSTEISVPATCTTDGLKVKKCNNCNATMSEAIPATGHCYDHAEEKIATNNDGSGEVYLLCDTCGEAGKKVVKTILATEQQNQLDNAAQAVEKADTSDANSLSNAVSSLTSVDNQDLIDTGSMSVVEALDKKLTKADESTGQSKVGSTQINDEEGAVSENVEVSGAAVTVDKVVTTDTESYDSSETYAAQLSITEAGTEAVAAYALAVEEATETPVNDYTVDISLNIVDSKGNVVASKVQLEAPLRITMPVPETFWDGSTFKLIHYVEQEGSYKEVELSYECSTENKTITFLTPSLSQFSVIRVKNKDCAAGNHTVDSSKGCTNNTATCTKAGTQDAVCADCGETFKVKADALGHKFNEENVTVIEQNTCTTSGKVRKKCTHNGCNETVEITTNPTGHSWPDNGAYTIDKAATCCQAGSESRTCTNAHCSLTENKETRAIPATGEHFYSESYTVDTPATCTAAGSQSRHCTTEGCTAKTGATAISATGHAWEKDTENAKNCAATCTKPGLQVYVCSHEGCTETKNEILVLSANAHTWATEASVLEAPTCGKEGKEVYYCTNEGCTAYDETRVVNLQPTGNHTWDAGTVTTQPTCEKAGVKIYHCTGCTATKPETVKASGHSYSSAYTVDTKATCEKAGSKSKHCTNAGCTAKTEVTVIPAFGHSWETIVTKQATCGAAGSQYRKCKTCGTKETAVTIPATGKHSYANYAVTKEATVLSAGTKAGTCKVCGQKDNQVIAKLAGTIKLTESKLTIQLKKSVNLKSIVTGLSAGDSIKGWQSSNTKIAAINQSGKVTAKKVGNATITVTLASGASASLKLTVQKKAVATQKITVASKKLTLEIGKKLKIEPIITPITTLDKVTYKSSNKKIVTVDAKGNIKAVKSGSATITITSGKKSVKVKVTVPKLQPTKITGVATKKTLKKGKSFTLKPKLSPNGAEAKITYSSSNKKVATVTTKGKVTAKGKGTAVITVKAGNLTATCTITVR